MNNEVIIAKRKAIEDLNGAGYYGRRMVDAISALISKLSFTSSPPSGYHKIYNIYAKKVGGSYHLVLVIESEPEP